MAIWVGIFSEMTEFAMMFIIYFRQPPLPYFDAHLFLRHPFDDCAGLPFPGDHCQIDYALK
jgi:hypothetical protein